ncbi:hypothetical protein G6F35_005012 [Rhizopus arrhizus]|nr:hypothetical protein G6F23_000073 [Rhizopus arrhizus]KAG1222868.1 hypothetical protein G6F35_005012 [Rhizopus arrhizus]
MFEEDDEQNRPGSPVAPAEEELDEWLNHLSNVKITRAASMPPAGSSSHLEEPEFRRSASMEPFFSENTVGRGNPPYAPLVRNADAPVLNMQPIAEDLFEHHPFIQEPLVDEGNDDHEEDEEEEEVEEEEEEEDLGNFGDDIEGVLEAIGMHGSFWILLQNATLMFLLIALVLFTVICLPYMIGVISILSVGKEIAGLPLELIGFIHKNLGKITDPLIDPILSAYFDYVWPSILLCCELYLNPLMERYLGKERLLSDQSASSAATGVDHLIALYHQSKPILESAYHRYQAFAIGESSGDRFVCILIGYATLFLFACVLLTRSKMIYTLFGDAAQEALREYLVILKLTMFIAIELLVFPLFCGAVLDLSTLPLFEGASVTSRVIFLKSSPVSSLFIHWFLGTGFIFLFAVFVTLCRSIVRPGVMWFIRDPTDPQFHPLREIVERPILFQYQKIGSSGLVYVFAIFICIGGVVHTINLAGNTILPLRWSPSSPLSTIPIDLLTTQLVLPAVINYLQPKRVFKKWFVDLIVFSCRQLRLTSFLFGTRNPEEEGDLIYHTWSAWIRRAKPPYYPHEPTDVHGAEVSFVWNGQCLRVPNHDRVPVVPNRRMLVPVDPFAFEPLDDTERQMGHPADGANETNNTVIVYSPPNFYRRVLMLVIIVWLVSTTVACAFAFIPLMLGRWLFRLAIEQVVHDVYSYTIGASVLFACWSIASFMLKVVTDVHKQQTTWLKLKRLFKHVKRWLFKAWRWMFFLISFGILLPLAFGVLLELYLVLPSSKKDKPLELKIIPIWANGVASMVIAHGFIHVLPENRWRRSIGNVLQGGIGRMNIMLCLKEIIKPVVTFSMIAICAPPLMAYIDHKLLGKFNGYKKSIRIAYPTALIGSGIFYLISLLSGLGRNWAETIREETYLVGRILHNHDN